LNYQKSAVSGGKMDPLKLYIKSRIYFDSSLLPSQVRRVLIQEFTYNNPNYIKMRRMGFPTYSEPQKLYGYRTENKKYMSVCRGGILKLKRIFNTYKVPYEIIYKTISGLPPINLKKLPSGSIKLRDDQEMACLLALRCKQGLIQGVCASGKTEIALDIIYRIQAPTLVIVHTQKLMDQWVARIKQRFDIDSKDIGLIQGQKNRIGKITIAMQQTLRKRIDEFKDSFEVLICDEVHHFSAPTFDKVIDVIGAQYRFGVSATMTRRDGKEIRIEDQFGQKIAIINDKILQQQEDSAVMEVQVKIVETDFFFDYGWSEKFKDEYDTQRALMRKLRPMEKAEKLRKYKQDLFKENGLPENNHNDYLSAMIKNKRRNTLIIEYMQKEVKEGNFCLILSDRIDHCHLLIRRIRELGIETKLIIGGDKYKEEGDQAIELMKQGKLHVIVAISKIADEALDIPILNRIFITSHSASNEERMKQQIGRAKRVYHGKVFEKKDAKAYYFLDVKIDKFRPFSRKLKNFFNASTVRRSV